MCGGIGQTLAIIIIKVKPFPHHFQAQILGKEAYQRVAGMLKIRSIPQLSSYLFEGICW